MIYNVNFLYNSIFNLYCIWLPWPSGYCTQLQCQPWVLHVTSSSLGKDTAIVGWWILSFLLFYRCILIASAIIALIIHCWKLQDYIFLNLNFADAVRFSSNYCSGNFHSGKLLDRSIFERIIFNKRGFMQQRQLQRLKQILNARGLQHDLDILSDRTKILYQQNYPYHYQLQRSFDEPFNKTTAIYRSKAPLNQHKRIQLPIVVDDNLSEPQMSIWRSMVGRSGPVVLHRC